MVYSKQFVAVLTQNGKILRESRSGQEDVISIPFGAEYGIRLKNLSSNRAAIDVSIDNVDVLGGHRIVLGAGETHDLEGFMENGNVRNKFKFIQKTKEIADHRGDFIDDGIVKISYQFEKPVPQYNPPTIYPGYPWNKMWGDMIIGSSSAPQHGTKCHPGPSGQSLGHSGNILRSMNCCFHDSDSSFSKSVDSLSVPAQDEGITVKGSQTNINYSSTYLRELFPEIGVITFKLVGMTRNNTRVIKPVTVRTRLVCSTCGRSNESRNTFCSNCGTCLK